MRPIFAAVLPLLLTCVGAPPCAAQDRSLVRGDLVVLLRTGGIVRSDSRGGLFPFPAAPPWSEAYALRITRAGDAVVLARAGAGPRIFLVSGDPPHFVRAIEAALDLPACRGMAFGPSGAIVLVRREDGALVRVFPDGAVAMDPPAPALAGADGIREIEAGWLAWSRDPGWVREVDPAGEVLLDARPGPVLGAVARCDGELFVLAGDPPAILRRPPGGGLERCGGGATLQGAGALALSGESAFAAVRDEGGAWRLLEWRGCVGPGPRATLPEGAEPVALEAVARAAIQPGDLVLTDLGFTSGVPAIRAWRPPAGRVRTLWSGGALLYPTDVSVGRAEEAFVSDPRAGRLFRLELREGPDLLPFATPLPGVVQSHPIAGARRLVALSEEDAIGGVYEVDERSGAVEPVFVGGSLLGCSGVAAAGARIYAASASSGAVWAIEEGVPRLLARGFPSPAGLAIDPTGAALLADAELRGLWRVTWEGDRQIVRFGDPFVRPVDACADPDGTIWVSDPVAGAVFRIEGADPPRAALATDGTGYPVDAPAGIDRAAARPLARALVISLGAEAEASVLASALGARRFAVDRAVEVPAPAVLASYRAVFVSAAGAGARSPGDGWARLAAYLEGGLGAALYVEARDPIAADPLLVAAGVEPGPAPGDAAGLVARDPDRPGRAAARFPDAVLPGWTLAAGPGARSLVELDPGGGSVAVLRRAAEGRVVLASLALADVAAGWASTRDDLAGIYLRGLLGGKRALVFQPPAAEGGAVEAAAALAEALGAAWLAVDRTCELPALEALDGYDLVAVSLGTYPRTADLSAADAGRLRAYLIDGTGGAGLYVEGGGWWIVAAPTALHAHFGYVPVPDGARRGAYGAMQGRRTPPADASDLRFPGPWRGEIGPADRIVAAGPGRALLQQLDPPSDVMILTDGGFWRTVGSTAALAGLSATPEGSREELMARIVEALTDLPAPPRFVRGDANGSGRADIADAIYAIAALFGAGSPCGCEDACDANDDGRFNVADPIYAVMYLFRHTAPPPPPFPGCGADPTPDALGCGARRCPR